jgi:hypothetical protein
MNRGSFACSASSQCPLTSSRSVVVMVVVVVVTAAGGLSSLPAAATIAPPLISIPAITPINVLLSVPKIPP